MSRNGSGVYSLPAGNPVVTGTTISSSWANTTLSDIATALTGSIAADGQTAMTGNLQMGNNKVTGLANGTTSTDALAFGQISAGTLAGSFTTLTASSTATLNTLVSSGATLTGGTINGMAIGGSTPSTGAFTTLSASSTVSGTGFSTYLASPPSIGSSAPASGAFTTLSASGVATFSAGTVSAPAITTTGDTNTGIYFPAADTIAFAEGGVESMRLNSSGNVGIGTSSPASSNGNVGRILQTAATGNTSATTISSTAGTGIDNAGIFEARATAQSSGSDRLGQIYFGRENTSTTALSSYAAFGTSGSGTFAERMRIDSSGNVGIGTSSPLAFGGGFLVSQTTGSSGGYSLQSSGSIFTQIAADSTASVGYTGTRSNHPFVFTINNTERMRIDASGNLLVGTTSGSAKVTSIGTSTAAPFSAQVNTNGFYGIEFKNASGATVGNITVNSSTTTYNTSSDYRLKENIQPMTGALDKVAALKPVTYKWKVDGSNGEGFIAHELQEVVPDCVTGEKDAVDAEGKPVYQGIDTSFLVGVLTASIQELKAIVDAQAERIAVLESK